MSIVILLNVILRSVFLQNGVVLNFVLPCVILASVTLPNIVQLCVVLFSVILVNDILLIVIMLSAVQLIVILPNGTLPSSILLRTCSSDERHSGECRGGKKSRFVASFHAVAFVIVHQFFFKNS